METVTKPSSRPGTTADHSHAAGSGGAEAVTRSEPRTEQAPDRVRPDEGARSPAPRPPDDHDGKDPGADKPKSRWPLIILGIVVLLAIIGGGIYWFLTRGQEDTDDAYTEGNAISIAANVSGYVTELDVNDNSVVKVGQLLFKIDPRTYIAARDQARANLSLAQAQLASSQVNLEIARVQLASSQVNLEIARVRAPANLLQAQAQLAQAQATVEQARQNYSRQHQVDPRATTQTNIDQANAQLKSDSASVKAAEANQKINALVQQNIDTAADQVKQSEAQVAQAQANLATAEVNLSYTEVRAPQDGFVTQRNVDLGTYVQAGQQSFYLVAPQVWVVANFKENQLARMRPGQLVTMTVDAYPDLTLHGHVDSIQHGSGARFSAFPAENATGNYVKIVRRVPVKIIIESGLPSDHGLPLGLSVEPTVTVQ
jgi:membrane fusion protein (multidrug efflux system)